jgi:AbrB family looped-hinge helix DNA binding protein
VGRNFISDISYIKVSKKQTSGDLMMRMSEIVRIDSRGRVTLPSSIRDAAKLSEGMYVMLVADLSEREVRILPFADTEAKLVEIRITLSDIPGALAQAADVLAKEGIDLLSSESRTLKRGASAEWVAIADTSKCKCDLEELERKVAAEKAISEVKLKSFP